MQVRITKIQAKDAVNADVYLVGNENRHFEMTLQELKNKDVRIGDIVLVEDDRLVEVIMHKRPLDTIAFEA